MIYRIFWISLILDYLILQFFLFGEFSLFVVLYLLARWLLCIELPYEDRQRGRWLELRGCAGLPYEIHQRGRWLEQQGDQRKELQIKPRKCTQFHGREAIDYEVFAKVNCVNSKLVYKACYTLAMATIMETALQIAEQTGELLRGYFRSANLHSSLKADQSVVTDADYAADEFIQSALQREFPHDLIMSEERKTRLIQKELSDHRSIWMIDPLDGTTNFSLGLHIWGVLLTQLVNGFPERAALHFPILQETYWAEKGRGAFMNNEPIHVQPPRKDYPLPFFACCSRTFQMHEINVPYKPRILGSAAYSMCCVARGVAVLGFDATPKIWDIAGAWLLVREAGGVIETIDCPNPFPLQANIDYTQTNLKTLAAATKKSLLKANQQIIPKT